MSVYSGAGLFVLAWMLYVPAAAAGENYKCTIERVEHSHGEKDSPLRLYIATYVGKTFTVDRKTGLMKGAIENSYATIPEVVDPGSKDNSFKVVTTMKLSQGAGKGSNLYALVIDEFVESPRKPFVFLQNEAVYFGYCEHP
jgi:hypothetical protein